MTFADTLRDFRAFAAWSQTDLADAIPVTTRTLIRWENGHVKTPVPIIRQRLRQIMAEQHYDPRARKAG